MPVVIPYYGGKYRLCKSLIPMIPKHKHYIEVFAGGLSMFFHKAKAEWNCVNDISNDLVNLYMVIGDKKLFEIFSRKVYYALKSRTYYEQIKDEVRTNGDFEIPDVDRAFKYYYFVRNSFNSRLNTAFNRDITGWTISMLNTLKFARNKLDGVIIENLDFSVLVDKYSHKSDIFWYFDPPYTMANDEKYYVSSFTEKQHIQMFNDIEMLSATTDAKIMISYDNSDFVKELYKNFYINEVETKYSGNIVDPNKTFIELVITNYITQSQEIINF